MSFLKFIKDRKLYILIYYISIVIASLVSILDALNNSYKIKLSNVFYVLFLTSLLLFLFLYYDYRKKSKFLNILNENKDKNDLNYIFRLEESISPEYEIIQDAIISNFEKYTDILNLYKDQSELNNKFNNRWIHEMKTPISVLKLMVEREKKKVKTDEDLINIISMEEELDKLSSGLELALYTLRINDFEEDFKVEKININNLVTEVINENKSLFILNKVYPKNFTKEDYIVVSDRKWIKFVLKQLISNSVKYTKVKDIKEKNIIFTVTEDEKNIYLNIKDNGIGIQNRDIKRVTQAFYTGNNGRKYFESTGMGLYLVKETLDRLGHNLIIESKEGLFTSMTINFSKGESIYNIYN